MLSNWSNSGFFAKVLISAVLDIEEEDKGVSMGQNIMNGFDEEIFSSDEEES